jgi:xanthine dehydrogenase YagR molybdenum-binding subunit
VSVTLAGAVGAAIDRVEGRAKVTGEAKYAYEYHVDDIAYAAIVPSTIAKGAVRDVDAAAVLELPGVHEVIWHGNAPRLHEVSDGELEVFQSDRVSYRGQIVAAVIADSHETARQAERLLRVEYASEPHDVLLRADHPDLYTPEKVNPNYPAVTEEGDFDSAFASAAIAVDCTYETPAEHNNPMEPHATLAVWHEEGGVTIYDSNQGVVNVRNTVARAFGLEPGQVRVISPHVGGGFGSKGTPRPHVIVAIMASQTIKRPVKLAVTRQQMFAVTGYRTPTIQRMRLGADRDGRLVAICHDAIVQSSTIREFAEQAALPSRMMYAAPNRRTTHRLTRLNVPTPSWMRAPGETPGMFALESAMDELALACGIDPIELRVRNDPEVDPASGHRFSSRNLEACLRDGAERFGWADRDPRPATRRDGRWLIGTGVASSTYPARRQPSSARASYDPGAGYVIQIAAADIGTGARTALTQIAADALEVPVEQVEVQIGDSSFPEAFLAGGSMGNSSWGSAVVKACRELRARMAEASSDIPLSVDADTKEEVAAASKEPLAKHGFGAQFVEARVDVDTGEVQIPRALGVFAVGRIINPKTARSQFIGGMTMGIGMALHEESLIDLEFGDYLNHDLAGYHVPTNADIEDIEVTWLDEDDPHVNPMGAKGIGEIGIVGTAAAVAGAVYHATGIRVRDLPIRPDKLIGPLAGGTAASG